MVQNLVNRRPGKSGEIIFKIGGLEVEAGFWMIFDNFDTVSVACSNRLHQTLRNPIGIMFLNASNYLLIHSEVSDTNFYTGTDEVVRNQVRCKCLQISTDPGGSRHKDQKSLSVPKSQLHAIGRDRARKLSPGIVLVFIINVYRCLKTPPMRKF